MEYALNYKPNVSRRDVGLLQRIGGLMVRDAWLEGFVFHSAVRAVQLQRVYG